MVNPLELEPFLECAATDPLIDVRTPEEYRHAHIPGATNLPLFSKEERAEVGVSYRKEGRNAAIKVGLRLVGPKLESFIEQASPVIDDRCLVYCWRGGMRSASLAWLLDFYGYEVHTLEGGYKSFRRGTLDLFDSGWKFIVLGGKTGSGKTEILHELKKRGEQIVDLEALACHKGSAFGGLGQPDQPSQEHFENMLGQSLRALDRTRRIWIEDESRHIGRRILPKGIWEAKTASPLLFLEIPIEARAAYLAETYGTEKTEGLAYAIRKIERRLGGLDTRKALDALLDGRLEESAAGVLRYYDRAYAYDLTKRPQESISVIPASKIDVQAAADRLLAVAQKLKKSDKGSS